MDDGVKQRIIGAFVLLALAVIFIPVFFDRERMEPVDRASQIPLAPEFSAPSPVSNGDETVRQEQSHIALPLDDSDATAPLNATAVTAGAAEISVALSDTTETLPNKAVTPTMPPNNSVAAEKMFIPNDSVPESPEPVVSRLDANGVPESWVLQVASFSVDGYAKQMRDDLVKMGFKAYIRSITTGKGNKLTRVYVGPKLDKSRLVEAQKQIEAKYKIKTSLLKFKP